MRSYNSFVIAAPGLDIPSLEKQRPLSATSFRGRAHVVAVSQDPSGGQQTRRQVTDGMESASNPSKVSWVSLNRSPSRFQERLRRCFEHPSTPAGTASLDKSLHGLQLTGSPALLNQTGNACGLGQRSHRYRFGAPRAKGPSQPLPPPPSKQRALVIGINGSGRSEDRLDYAVRDAKRFEDCLKGPLGFDTENIQVLTDADATRPEIFKKLRWLFDGTRPGDLRVLYISGHCSLNELNKVVSLETEKDGTPQSVPATTFKTHFDKLPEGCTVEVVLDCCYSAGLIKLPNVIEEMVSNSGQPVNVLYTSRDFPEASGYQKNRQTQAQGPALSPSGREPTRPSGGADRPLDIAERLPLNDCKPSQRVGDGPRPDQNIATKADVTVWAACKKSEKAYESAKVKNGILTNAICSVIEERGRVERSQIWNQVVLNTESENKLGSRPAQHSQVLSSQDMESKEKIMRARAFQ